MNITIENIILIGSILLFISVISGKASYKYGVPTLILFLAIGMLAGSDGIGGIEFYNPEISQFVGVVALNVILFSGGLDTKISSIKPVLKTGLTLSTLGVLITALTLALFVYWITDFTFYESLLLGSIVSSTDAAAVFSILKSKHLELSDNLKPTLELESGSNDPMAYILTISSLSLVEHPGQSILTVIPTFIIQMLLGVALGFAFGYLSNILLQKFRLGIIGLYPVLFISIMFITFSVTQLIYGNGFLAIYICAVYLGNKEFPQKKEVFSMFDGTAWLMQIILFLTLGLLVFPSQVIPVAGIGILISLFQILISRPVSVFISLAPFKTNLKSKVFISWVGLRGAVPIVFATYPLIAGIDKAGMIFNIVFFISVSSVLIQGTTLGFVAKLLGIIEKPGNKRL